jgi:hypothetical protein
VLTISFRKLKNIDMEAYLNKASAHISNFRFVVSTLWVLEYSTLRPA